MRAASFKTPPKISTQPARNLLIVVAAIVAASIGAYLWTGPSNAAAPPPESGSNSAARDEAEGDRLPNDLGEFLVTCYDLKGSLTETQTVPVWGTAAVDPDTIPLGSKLSIAKFPGTVFTAADTGARINGRHIDLWNSKENWCRDFGAEHLEVTLLGSG